MTAQTEEKKVVAEVPAKRRVNTKRAPKTEVKADAKAPAKAKPAAKVKAAPKSKAPTTGKVKYTLIDRPSGGKRLFAYTQAILELTGLDKGKALHKTVMHKLSGATAVSHHLKKGTMALDDKGNLSLTAAGKASFGERKASIDPAILDAYKTLMTTGLPVDPVCKNKALIVEVA